MSFPAWVQLYTSYLLISLFETTTAFLLSSPALDIPIE